MLRQFPQATKAGGVTNEAARTSHVIVKVLNIGVMKLRGDHYLIHSSRRGQLRLQFILEISEIGPQMGCPILKEVIECKVRFIATRADDITARVLVTLGMPIFYVRALLTFSVPE